MSSQTRTATRKIIIRLAEIYGVLVERRMEHGPLCVEAMKIRDTKAANGGVTEEVGPE
jgi:hypothetical protein